MKVIVNVCNIDNGVTWNYIALDHEGLDATLLQKSNNQHIYP